MNLIEAWHRVKASLRRRRLERDLDEEIAFHLAMRETSSTASGASTADAQREARRRFGNVTAFNEQLREMWTFPWLDSVWQDAKYAGRTLGRQPGFTAVAVSVLGVVTGLNTSLFMVFDALTFRAPTGIREPGRVVSLYPVVPRGEADSFSVAEYRFLADNAKSLNAAAIGGGGSLPLGPDGVNGRASTFVVSGTFFETLGITTIRGRGLASDDDRPDNPRAVAVLGARLWEIRFGSDPEIVGRSVLINNVPFTVVGIASRDFVGMEPAFEPDPGLFLPINAFPLARPQVTGSLGSVEIVGRLVSGATREQARAEANLLLRRFDLSAGTDPREIVVAGTAFLSHPGRAVILSLLALLSAALMLVWLLACANVGNLQMARAAARSHEIAVRVSLGAGRSRVIRQLLTEGFVLALAAGTLGVVIAWTLPTLLFRVFGDASALDRMNFSLAPNSAALLYAVLLAGATAVAFSLAPALHITRTDVSYSLRDRDGLPASRFPLRGMLLAVQVAVSVIILVGAGLLVRRVQRQASFDPGFPLDDIRIVAFMPPTGNEFIDASRQIAFITDLTEAMRQASFAEFGFSSMNPFSFGGAPIAFRHPDQTPDQAARVSYADISTGYLEALRIPIVAGRGFETGDASRHVALINESMARKYWPNEDPIGKSFIGGKSEAREVVGIVRDVSNGFDEAFPMFYRPIGSAAAGGAIEVAGGRRIVTAEGGPLPQLYVRTTSGEPDSKIASVVARIDPRMRVRTRPLAAIVEELQQSFRIGPMLAALLGMFALALATVGMFGVFAYAVRQRTREIGIRMALGAQSFDVVRLILAGHSRALLGGLAAGFLGSLVAAQLIRSFTYGVSPFDPLAYLGVALLLGAAGLAASFVPARRATRINPIEALRCD